MSLYYFIVPTPHLEGNKIIFCQYQYTYVNNGYTYVNNGVECPVPNDVDIYSIESEIEQIMILAEAITRKVNGLRTNYLSQKIISEIKSNKIVRPKK
jgi:hypothetical protein